MILYMTHESGKLVAKDEYGSRIWSEDYLWTNISFMTAVGNIIDSAYKPSIPAVVGLNKQQEELMIKMAKRLDEIDSTDEWSKLERMARVGGVS